MMSNEHGHRYDFARLKARVSIAHLLHIYDLHRGLRARGEQLVGPCPVHGGDNPTAFRVHLRRGIWQCFSNCQGGDIVDLVMAIEGCTFAEAARILARVAYGPAPPPSLCASTGAAPPSPGFRPFRRRIPLDPRAPFLQDQKRITIDTAARFEAGIAAHSAFLRGTIAVRLHDMSGHPLGYCGRRLDPADIARWGKWRFPRGFPKRQTLYNAHRARAARCRGIVVVECPWAVMRLSQAGVPGAVALLGTTLSPPQAAWLAKAPAVLLLLDGDDPARRAARSIAKSLSSIYPRPPRRPRPGRPL